MKHINLAGIALCNTLSLTHTQSHNARGWVGTEWFNDCCLRQTLKLCLVYFIFNNDAMFYLCPYTFLDDSN